MLIFSPKGLHLNLRASPKPEVCCRPFMKAAASGSELTFVDDADNGSFEPTLTSKKCCRTNSPTQCKWYPRWQDAGLRLSGFNLEFE